MELRMEDGTVVGTATVQRQGEESVFAVTACLPDGLWRIVARGTAGELSLGVVEGGACTLHRRFSRPLTDRLGAVRSVTARRAGARMESEWQACVAAVPDLPPLYRGVLCRGETWGRTLAFPWREGDPFPWTERFCLARVGSMAGRLWVFYALDKSDRPIWMPKK